MGKDNTQPETFGSFLSRYPSPITHHAFTPAWWCRGPHAQTLWPYLLRRRPKVALRRERVELPDGDFLDLDWLDSDTRGPIVLILHGLEGSSDSKYALGMLRAVNRRGWRGVVMHFRGCSGEPNRLTRSYHSGETSDIDYIVSLLKQREPATAVAAIGYSLGGNVLLKWLSEVHTAAPVVAAAAVSVPFLLAKSAWRMERGFSRVYQWSLVQRLKRGIVAKVERMTMPIRIDDLPAVQTFWEFDDRVTAPLHGFAGADDYYAKSSSRQYLNRIAAPTLIVHSSDDPFMTSDTPPTRAELSASVQFELYAQGGHVGFVSGTWPWRPLYWLEERIPSYLAQYFSGEPPDTR